MNRTNAPTRAHRARYDDGERSRGGGSRSARVADLLRRSLERAAGRSISRPTMQTMSAAGMPRIRRMSMGVSWRYFASAVRAASKQVATTALVRRTRISAFRRRHGSGRRAAWRSMPFIVVDILRSVADSTARGPAVVDTQYVRTYYTDMARASLRDQIVAAGLRVMLRKGYVGSGVRDIVAEAGVPQGSFTNHFRSKEEFAAAVLDHYFEHVKDLVRQALEDRDLT